MAKFRKGDRVRIANPVPCNWSVGRLYGVGATGTVVENDSETPDVVWHEDDDVRCCPEDCLELIEPRPDRMDELEARVAELERALAAKQEPQPEPEFLEGRRRMMALLENGGAIYNRRDGKGICIGPDHEAVILPWPGNEGGSIIRFRRKQ